MKKQLKHQIGFLGIKDAILDAMLDAVLNQVYTLFNGDTRYMLYNTIEYSENGTMYDCIGRYSTVQEAMDTILKKEYFGFYYIFDRWTGETVHRGEMDNL